MLRLQAGACCRLVQGQGLERQSVRLLHGSMATSGAGGGEVTETETLHGARPLPLRPLRRKGAAPGVNEMVVWLSTGNDGMPEFAEIAKTGANAVRIVCLTTESAADLDRTITNALSQKLTPMVELHDAAGKWEDLP